MGNDLRCFGSRSWDPIFVSITLPLTLQWLHPLVLWSLSSLTSETTVIVDSKPLQEECENDPKEKTELMWLYLHCFSFLRSIFLNTSCTFFQSLQTVLFYLILIIDFDKKVILVLASLFAWITENPFYTDVLKCTMSKFIFSLKKYLFIYIFYFTILYWFRHRLTWIHYGCTCVLHPEPPSHLPLNYTVTNTDYYVLYKFLNCFWFLNLWFTWNWFLCFVFGYILFSYINKQFIEHIIP